MVDKLPKYRRGIGTGRTIAPKLGGPAGVAMLPNYNIYFFDGQQGQVRCSFGNSRDAESVFWADPRISEDIIT